MEANLVSNNKGRTRRLISGLVAAISLSTALAGAAFGADEDRLRGLVEAISAKEPFKIGVTVVHVQDDFWKGIAYGIADEAKRSNVEVLPVYVAGGYGNVKEQFGQLDTLNSLGADVIVLGPAAYSGFNPVLKRLKEGGATVVAAGIPVDSPNVDFGIAQADGEIGRAQADSICADAGANNVTALVIPGPAGAEWARLRLVAFAERIKEKCPNVAIIDGPPTSSTSIESGLAQASDMLLKHPDITYIETPVNTLGMGAVQAARQAGRKDVKVLASGVVREELPMIEKGEMLAVGSEPGIIMGRLIVQYAIRQKEGLPMEGLTTEGSAYPAFMVPVTMITKENVASYAYDLYEFVPADWSITSIK